MLAQRLLMVRKALTYAQVVLQDKPVAFWQLNETSGTVAADSSGNGIAATIESGVTIGEPGIPAGGGSYLFNGSSGYCDVPANSLLCPLSEGTIEAWLNSSSTQTGDWVSTGGNTGYRVRLAGGTTPDIVYELADQLNSGQAIASGWNHVVITFDSSGAQIYQNGILVKSGGAAYSQSSGTQPLHIGACLTYREYYNGYLSNVAIYNSILSAARIQAHYNAGIA